MVLERLNLSFIFLNTYSKGKNYKKEEIKVIILKGTSLPVFYLLPSSFHTPQKINNDAPSLSCHHIEFDVISDIM